MNQSEVEDAAVEIIERRGRAAIERAKQEILNTQYDNGLIASALKYYAKVNLSLVMPIFPALMSISYEIANGEKMEKENIEYIGAAMVLIALSGDIHDDIIDQSTSKYSKKTVYGKFGGDIAILAGDALLIQGTTLLHNSCEAFTAKQRMAISSLVPKALFEIGKAEAMETRLRKKEVINPKEYFEIMRLKGIVGEIQCRIGGIIGSADEETLELIGRYGRTVGMLGTIKDEFNDVINYDEFEHRIKFECPPLPMVYAYQDTKVRLEIKSLINDPNSTRKNLRKIAKIVLTSEGTLELKRKMNSQINEEIKSNLFNKQNEVGKEASLLLEALSEGALT